MKLELETVLLHDHRNKLTVQILIVQINVKISRGMDSAPPPLRSMFPCQSHLVHSLQQQTLQKYYFGGIQYAIDGIYGLSGT